MAVLYLTNFMKFYIHFGVGQILDLPPGQTAAQVAAGYQITDPALYKEFLESEFDSACYNYPCAFTLTENVLTFDLDKAKVKAEEIIDLQSNELSRKTLEGLSYSVYVAQSTLPPEQRSAKYQEAITRNNTIAYETEIRVQSAYRATTIDELNSIVYPLQTEIENF